MIININEIFCVYSTLCLIYSSVMCHKTSVDIQELMTQVPPNSTESKRCQDCGIISNGSSIKVNLIHKVFCHNDQCQCPADYKYDKHTKSCHYSQCVADSDCQTYDTN